MVFPLPLHKPRVASPTGRQGARYAYSSSTLQKLLSITHLIFIWTAETKSWVCAKSWLASSFPFWSILNIPKADLSHAGKNPPGTPGPRAPCCLTLRPAQCSPPTQRHRPSTHPNSPVLHPELPSFTLPLLSSSFPSHPPVNSTCSLHVNLPYIPLHIHTFLFVGTAHSIRKGALLRYPSQLSNTLLLYSEIFDKYLTWLKGQSWNEERAKRDFSILTQSPVTSPHLLSRMYFWPQAA